MTIKGQANMAKRKPLLIIISTALALSPLVALAVPLVPCGEEGQPVCELCHFFVMFKRIIDFVLFNIVPFLAILLVVGGGMLYIFSTGDPSNVAKANSIFKSVAISLLIIYGSWLIVNLFFQVIGVQSWTGLNTWWEISGCPE